LLIFLYAHFYKTYYLWNSGTLHLALKSDINTSAEKSENHHISRMLCSFSHIPLRDPNVAGAISGYKAVVAQPSSLGILWHAYIWNLPCYCISCFPWNFLRSLRQVLLHFGRAFVSERLSKRRQPRLVKIEFQSVPSWSNRWIECHVIALIHIHLACQNLCT